MFVEAAVNGLFLVIEQWMSKRNLSYDDIEELADEMIESTHNPLVRSPLKRLRAMVRARREYLEKNGA